jgi:hypothetical protein
MKLWALPTPPSDCHQNRTSSAPFAMGAYQFDSGWPTPRRAIAPQTNCRPSACAELRIAANGRMDLTAPSRADRTPDPDDMGRPDRERISTSQATVWSYDNVEKSLV